MRNWQVGTSLRHHLVCELLDSGDVGLVTTSAACSSQTNEPNRPGCFFPPKSSFQLPNGVKGNAEDVFGFKPTALGSQTTGTFAPSLAFDGSRFGLGPFQADDFYSFRAKPIFNVVRLGATPNDSDDEDTAAIRSGLASQTGFEEHRAATFSARSCRTCRPLLDLTVGKSRHATKSCRCTTCEQRTGKSVRFVLRSCL